MNQTKISNNINKETPQTKNSQKKTEKPVKGGDFLNLALYAFAGLGLDVVLLMVELAVYGGEPMNEWPTERFIIHWILICILWGVSMWWLTRFAGRKYGVTMTTGEQKIPLRQWALVLLCVLINLAWSAYSWGGFKVLIEFQRVGALKFIFQYIYYFFETGLVFLIIFYGQKALELWFHKGKTVPIPYGGLVLGITWGMVHAMTKGSLLVGLSGAGSSVLYGVVYLLLNRNYKLSFVLLFSMFIL